MLAFLSILAAILAGVALLLGLALASVHRRHHPRFTLPKAPDVARDLPSLAGLSYGELTSGNRVRLVEDDAYLPACIELIDGARATLHFETFLWRSGRMSAEIARALERAARRGVEVRLLLDAVGSRSVDPAELARLERAGAQTCLYRPAGVRHLGWLNNRTHRKVVVADGRRAIVGGHCVDDRWIGGAGAPPVRDVSVEVEGPVVRSIQSAFCENWIEATFQVPYGPHVFPHIEPAGDVRAHLAYVRPSGGVSSIKLLHHLAIRVAARRLWIATPYFVPDDGARRALVHAVERGVDVRVLMPTFGASDNALVARAGRHRLAPLLERGLRVHQYPRALLHQKVWTVDGEYALIGSTNFDERSFDLDDQVTLAVADADLVRALDERFLADLARSTPLDAPSWRRRPAREKVGDALAYLLREQL
ncbi:MAG TPA: phospholipase D-like domain-containing protein [Sandaracinaceae bacterium]